MSDLLHLSDTIKIGKDTKEYFINYECPVCTAKIGDKEMRIEIDKFLISHPVTEAVGHFIKYGLYIKESTYKTHIKKHSSYITETKKEIKKLTEKTSLAKLDAIQETYIDPDEVITEIITMGGQMVRTGEMEITEKLLLGALKEQGMRKKTGTIRDLMEGLDKNRFPVLEAELVKEALEE